MHYHYLTITQREALETLMRSQIAAGTELQSALERLHQPDYGVCVDCGRDIAFVRLEDEPLALRCQQCAA
jgi:RNA polymerase-binding transcription factor DksA